MALSPVLPRPNAPIVTASGLTTSDWFEFFRLLRTFAGDNAGVLDAITALEARVLALENAEEDDARLIGPLSVRVTGSLASGLVQFYLLGDVDEPGNTYFYGTGPDGVKGFYSVRSALDFGDGIDLVTGDDGITEISFNADTGEVAHITGATYTTVQKYIDTTNSPGIITGGDLSQFDATTVRMSAGTGIVRIADDDVSTLQFFDFAQQDFSIPADQETRYFAMTYNGGSPIAVMQTVDDFDRDTELPLGSAVRFNGTMVVTPNKYRTGDPITNIIQRFDANFPASRDNSIGGLQLGETGTRNVTLSAGRIWSRLSDFDVDAKNSSVDTMVTAYFNGTNLTFTTGITQWDNLNFNNIGTGALQALANNKWANLWFFVSVAGSQYGFAYGTDEYNTLGEAANEDVPAYLTQDFFNQALLLGRFIFQEGAATTGLIESAFATLFTTQAVNTHNDLGGLQGGVSGEYYHLTAAEYAAATTGGLNPYATYLVDEAGDFLVDENGDFLVSDDGFPIPLEYGGTGGDYASVAANRIFASPNGSAGAPTFRAMVLPDLPSGGTTGQFLRGDLSYTNEVIGALLATIDGAGVGLTVTKYSNDAAAFQYRSQKARGTSGSPAAVQSGDALVNFQGRGYYETAGVPTAFSGNMGDMALNATEGWTNTAQGCRWVWSTTPIGSTTRGDRLLLDDLALKPATDNAVTSGASVFRWSAAYMVNLHRSGAMFDTGVVSPAQLTANTDNWSVTGLGTAGTIRASTDASRNLTGIASPTSGQRVLLVNIGAFDLVLVHDATSTAANRFLCPGSANLTLNPNDSVTLWYDITSTRWRVLGT